jgi:hypothetical protein
MDRKRPEIDSKQIEEPFGLDFPDSARIGGKILATCVSGIWQQSGFPLLGSLGIR